MALIPGTLPTGTCYGTPQDLLELFAQYLEIPAFTISSKVLYSSGVSPLPATDYLWVDTSDSTKLKVYRSIAGAYLEYPFAGNITSGSAYSETLISGKNQITSVDASDQFLVSQAGVNSVLKRALWSDVAKSIPSGSITFPMLSTSITQSDNVAKRTVKAWVNFNGGNLTVYSTQSFNISSITRIAGATTGGFRVTFATAMPAANYAVLGTVGQGNEVWNSVAAASVRIVSATTGYVDFVTPQQSSNAIDFGFTCIAILSS